ncbi:acyltransferase [Pseudomarimonas arenosa]|uniref:Acyltransferase n=1 Tax=Pseudomarimonas arenosa TaxID=2774145 RepID=A0AAW3ZH32_9GAMM|nr:acyltransferase [Pseudomarimonas arenosa]MBD8525408.1 acyltransferase [Pseudomarimonas arenosa]
MAAEWKQRPEGGGRFALWLIRSIAQFGGRMIARLCLFPITLYFFLVRGPERRASRAFLRRVYGRPASAWQVARHIHSFASTILDRVFMLSGQFGRFDIRVHGREQLNAAIAQRRGVLLFGSHHGSFEALRVLSRERNDVTVRVVMDPGQNAAITQLLNELCPEIAATVIDARQDGAQIALAIGAAAEQGALIGLLVDRARAGEPMQRVPFLGEPAPFPSAPWLIAAALKIPVLLCFGLYRGGRRYDLYFEMFDAEIQVPRRERASALLALQARYAERLEHYVRLAPLNWFNFYDFWQTQSVSQSDRSAADPAAVDVGHGSGRA